MCPNCRQHAPIVYRGVQATCTACGAPRLPLAGASVNLAGQPSRVGGTVARVFGWVVLAIGLLVAFGVAAACSAIAAPGAVAPYLLGVPIALVSGLVSALLLRSGKQLTQRGADTANAAQLQAAFALANTRGGVVTAVDLAHAIAVSPEQADAILTRMAKERSDQVTLEVDDDGRIFYRIATRSDAMAPNSPTWQPRVDPRVADVGARSRVEPAEPAFLDDEPPGASAKPKAREN